MKRTLKRELKELEVVEREAIGKISSTGCRLSNNNFLLSVEGLKSGGCPFFQK